jgi:hypothetical protein
MAGELSFLPVSLTTGPPIISFSRPGKIVVSDEIIRVKIGV